MDTIKPFACAESNIIKDKDILLRVSNNGLDTFNTCNQKANNMNKSYMAFEPENKLNPNKIIGTTKGNCFVGGSELDLIEFNKISDTCAVPIYITPSAESKTNKNRQLVTIEREIENIEKQNKDNNKRLVRYNIFKKGIMQNLDYNKVLENEKQSSNLKNILEQNKKEKEDMELNQIKLNLSNEILDLRNQIKTEKEKNINLQKNNISNNYNELKELDNNISELSIKYDSNIKNSKNKNKKIIILNVVLVLLIICGFILAVQLYKKTKI
jgi:hypothetical protein